jgi:hypothetical protein
MAEETQAIEGEEKPLPLAAQPWLDKLKDYDRVIGDKWRDQCVNLDKLYSRDERADSADRQYSIFWANIEVLRPAVYARAPIPVVAPRFKQPNPVASAASEILERCLITSYEQSDMDGCMQEVRDEFLRYGRGTAWARLSVDANETEKVEYDYVCRGDFAHDPKRYWKEVEWVARKSWVNREKGRERFNEYLSQYGKTFDDVPIKRKDQNSTVDKAEDQAAVWEIWDREGGQVIWVAEDFGHCVLDVQPPWFDLTGFWPCPRPAFSTVVPGKLKPVPDILQYKDQLEEINEYTARIAAIAEKIRLQGFYPAGAGEIADAIETAVKSLDQRATLIPVSSWAALGGIAPKDAIVWIPITEAVEAVKSLVELRRVLIDDVYQITGISDILRGDTEEAETATAQQIKSQWGSMRIRQRQNELARFARDMTRISAEVMAENFQPETVKAMSQTDLPSAQDKAQAQQQMAQPQQPGAPPPQVPPEVQEMLQKPSFEEVMAFLSDDKARGFTIEIETDSTIQPDEDAEKQRRVEFVTAIGGLFKEVIPAIQAMPQIGPFMGEVLKFTAQGFRAGRQLEGAIDQLVSQLGQMAQQPQQPDPKAEAEKVKAEATVKKTEMDMQRDQQKHGMDMQKMQAEAQMDQQELAFDQQRLNMEGQHMRMHAAQEVQQMHMASQQGAAQHDQAMQMMKMKASMPRRPN